MRRRQIVSDTGTCACGDRQREVQRTLPHEPHARLARTLGPEELKPRDRRERGTCRIRRHVLALDDRRKPGVGELHLAEEPGRLLPFAIEVDVGEVAAAEIEQRQQMPIILEIVAQVIPRAGVERDQIRKRRGPELWIFRHERHDLERVEVADDAEAAPPRIPVASVTIDQIPPHTHLCRERRFQRREDVLPIGLRRGVPHVARVLVRVAIEPARRRRII